MEEAKCELRHVEAALLDSATVMRDEHGVICEVLLKHLWKLRNKEDLFVKIIELFKKYNLTYPVHFDSRGTFYFFPHLKKSKLGDKAIRNLKQPTITLHFVISYFFPQFFVQRLALEFGHARDTEIFQNGFTTKTEDGVALSTEVLSTEEMKLCFSSKSIHDIWYAMPTIFQSIHNILSSYWKFHGSTHVHVYCPRCIEKTPNYLPLMQFTKPEVYDEFQSNCSLQCLTCDGSTCVECLMPPPTIDFSEIMECFRVKSDKEFIEKILFTWKRISPLPHTTGHVSQPSDSDSYSAPSTYAIAPEQAQT